ncbi:MAG: nucleotidyl transferase AbiEii/AbiGii toxin family protein [Deltaproteobacteria bacterium]|nr:nucleotidyl transferase AbiEii/AbiGii toxin family protein [Deltaproteobacteria bacterium]MDZ4341890.1 nucleotidyl transferase AbiEii/AbiGii toxin family protein [Candidatus Binatia bacterium]
MIPQSNLSRLANRLARAGGRRIPESVLERDYCLSWFLAGLSQSPLGDRLFFKGGTALKKCYFPDYRFSEDLDFTLAEEVPFETIRNGLDAGFEKAYQESGVLLRYARSDRQPHTNSHTFYLNYEGPLGNLPSGKEVKTDITIKEKVVFPIEARPTLRAYTEYEDLPGNAIIKVYSLKEIAAEKVIAVCDRARNEPRDLYDLWYLSENAHVDLIEIIDAIASKLEFRGQRLETIGTQLDAKQNRLRRLWNQRLAGQMATLPEFDGVFRVVRRAFRQAGIGAS